jgi:hypothetical protein
MPHVITQLCGSDAVSLGLTPIPLLQLTGIRFPIV